MLTWIKQSFARQTGAIMLITGLLLNSLYSFISYQNETRQLEEFIESEARQLTEILALLITDDLRYEKYYDLWDKIIRVKNNYRQQSQHGRLFNIRSIAILDKQEKIAGHTDPQHFPLKSDYASIAPNNVRHGHIFSDYHHEWRDDMSTLLMHIPLRFGDEVIGALLLELDPSPLIKHKKQLITGYVIYQFVLISIILILAMLFAIWIAKPVGLAVRVLDDIGKGNIHLRGLTQRQDEFGKLGEAIEKADQRIFHDTQKLQQQQDELEKNRKLLEQRVQQRTGELEEANKELAAFSYSVSHDLRSPLRAIDGFAQALDEDYEEKLDETGKNYIARIRAGVQRMSNLIDDMLMLSRVSRREIESFPVNLSEMAERIRRRLQEQDPDRPVEWNIARQVRVEGDPHLLEILMTNLLDNAWKYTGKTMEPRIEFGTMDEKGETVYFVRDNGAGFDMKYADKLFGVFQRLHAMGEFEGTGIGLATVARILQRHGGRIWADAQVDKGATFYFTIGERSR